MILPAATPLPDLPRARLLDGPTPLQPLPRLSAALGGRAELWVKREDLGPLAFSGNKLRNLEFLLGDALRAGANTIVTSGRRWSNHCRLAAAAGARLGLEVHIVVNGPPAPDSANLRLMRELGALIHEASTGDRAEREALVEDARVDAEARGRRARVLPVGGSDAVGAWGQVLGALEAIEQARAGGWTPDAIVLPTATGGTQAGLVVGAAIAASDARASAGHAASVRVVGIAVHPDPELRSKIERLVGALAGMAGITDLAGLDPRARPIELRDSQIGPGYGVSTAESVAASRLLSTTEGILVDPVYTAKGLAGLIELVQTGALEDRRVIFWHGGGLPALFEPSLGEPALRG
ncbi:MAG TPA: pyridoxal-phosphate dependent enzyme [Candidatus Limnocylindrales bacterium]|nr:pyridoxal-phosphate dependent enzyme [Candidatus Limnocylindrales bacterium]